MGCTEILAAAHIQRSIYLNRGALSSVGHSSSKLRGLEIVQNLIANRFVVLQKIGQGGFGDVYLVDDRETKEVCALKMLRPELSAHTRLQDLLAVEARTWMALGKHPNVVNARFVDKFNGQLSIGCEFIAPNETGLNNLESYLSSALIPLDKAIRWGLDICSALLHAKKKGLIAHRDLKPGNLMVDQVDTLKVTDFGVSLFNFAEAKGYIDKSASGTPAYMSPEQFQPTASIDMRSDIYSLGIILFQMVSEGRLPYQTPSQIPADAIALFEQIHNSFELSEIDSPLSPIITKCLKKSPQDRYQKVEELLGELETVYAAISGEEYRLQSAEEMNAAEETNYAASYMLLGQHEDALVHIDRAIEIAPSLTIAVNNKAAILAGLGRLQKAHEIWSSLTVSDPDLGRPFYNLGNLAMGKRDAEGAISNFKKAIDREPDYVPALVNLAIVYQNTGQVDNALAAYDDALSISPNDANIVYNKGFILYELKKYPESLKLFKKAIELDPSYLSALNYAGLCQKELGQYKSALNYFDQALRIDPSYPYARKNRSELLVSHKPNADPASKPKPKPKPKPPKKESNSFQRWIGKFFG